ncbi:hypothetical protein FHS27_003279 [Rhodopirellula rubra]|uniref:Circumsporozoite protein-putative membrane associated protein n=1 Tax=Aporhodopirellula rubra TaxID=980271 RepID=A0A7W5H6L7_9BACT|nr:circumsporozoite protein-membrane associated protein [Aporhodopirellula rubra]MBB3207458.1 hypothetical protein [Aporhodopirellula rubra]
MAITLFWIVVDQWIWSPGVAGRSLIAIALTAAGAAYTYLRLWPVMHLRVREDYAARALERDHPELGHSLSSYVSLRQQRVNHPRGQLADRVVQSVGANAATKLKHIDAPPSEATGLISWWVTAIALLAVIAAYALASPKNSAQSVARLVRPLASLDAPRRVQITDVSPGDTETLAGRSLEIAATVKNLRDDEPVYFRWESNQSAITKTSASLTQPTDDSATGNQQQTRMIANETDGQLDQYIATVPISHHAHGTRRYHIVAGDASSGPYEVTIRDTPVVQIREVIYLPPAYTGKTKHTGHTGSIQGVDGTKVELIATINRPITRAIIEFNPRKVGQDIQATAGASEMQISGDGTTVRFDFALRSRKGGAIELQDYRIRVWDDAGQTNGDPIIYPIRVIEDLPPEITIVVPQQSTKDVPIDSEQVFEIHAADVDYGLAEVEIEIHRGIDLIARSTLWKDPVGKRGNQVIEYRFRPSRMIVVGRDNGIRGRRGGGLIVGDEVEVVAIATDNRTDPNDKTIVPGVTRTQPVLLRITAASAVPNNQDSTQQPKQGEGDSSQEQGEGQSGEGEQGGSGGGQSGKGQQGEGQQGEGQQGEGQQGEGQQGEGQQGEGQQGEGQQGEGQQGEGQQGEGQQGEGQQGEGQQSDGQQDMSQDAGSSESGEQTDPQGGQPQDSQGQSGESSDPSDAEQQASSDQNAGSRNQGGKPNQGQTSGASDGKSDNAPEQPPQDDAEAFERIQDYLNEKRENQSRGQNQPPGQSSDQNQPNDTPENRNSNDESGDGSSGQSSEDRNTNPNDDAGSQRDPQNSGSDNDSMTNPNEGDSGSDSEKGDSAGQPEGGPKQGDSEQGDGEKGTGQQEDGQQSDGRQNDDRQGDSEQDAGKQGTGMNDDAGGQSGSEGSQEQSSTEPGEDGANEKEGAGEKEAGDNSSGESASGEDGSQSESASGKNVQPNESTPDGDSGKQGSDSQSGDPSSGKGENQPSESGDDSSSSDSDAGDSEAGDSGSKSGGDDSESSRSNPNGAPDKGAPNQNRDQQPNPSEDTDSESGLNDQPSGNSDSGTQSGDQSGQPSPTSDESGGESAQGGGSGQSGGGVGEEQSIENELPDPVDLEYTKAATDMVLDYLDETRTDPDPELLERLKWTDQDLKRFRQRWQDIKPIDGGPRVDAPPQSEIEEALRSLGMRPPGTAESNRRDQSDDIRGLRDSGNRRPAPADIRDAFEAFRRGLSQP